MSEPIYHGVVHDHLVVLPPDVQLPKGAQVEVRALARESQHPESLTAEEEFLRELVARGLLSAVPPATRPPLEGDRTPIQVAGTPLSEQIIAERR